MIVAVDVFVSCRDQLSLWRAGHSVPVWAEEGEEDVFWLVRAKSSKCDVVVTQDAGAARTAYNMGFHVVLFPNRINKADRTTEILFQLRQLEESERQVG